MKNQLFILAFLCLFFNAVSAQTNNTSIFEIKVYDDLTNVPLSDAYVELTQKDAEKLWFRTRKDGTYKVELKEGNYSMRVSRPGYEYGLTELEIKAGTSIEKIVKLTEFQKLIPEERGEPIPQLYGFWKVVYIDDGKNRVEQPEQIRDSGICFSEFRKHKPGAGNFFYYDGCNQTQGFSFKHRSKGEIKLHEILKYSSARSCTERNDELPKMVDQLFDRFHVSFINDDAIIIKRDSIEAKMERTVSEYYTEKGYMTGKIYDADTNTPIRHANIEIRKKGKFVGSIYTKEDGTFDILNFEEGKYQVFVNHPCYTYQDSIDIDIKNRQIAQKVVKLKKRENLTFDECNNSLHELYGFWKVDCIKYNNKKIRQRKQIRNSGITFTYTHKDESSLAYNDGCHDYQSVKIMEVKGRRMGIYIDKKRQPAPYYCEDKNMPLVEVMESLNGSYTYKFKNKNTLIITNDINTKPLKIQLSRAKHDEPEH